MLQKAHQFLTKFYIEIIFGPGVIVLVIIILTVGQWLNILFTEGREGSLNLEVSFWDLILNFLLLLIPLTSLFLGFFRLRNNFGPIIHIYLEGMDKRDYEVIQNILRDECTQKIELRPLQGGFSNTTLFIVKCQGQLPTVLKVGPKGKIETEERNYHEFIRNRIKTIQLMKTEYKSGRGAILYSYAQFTGETNTFEAIFHQEPDTDRIIGIFEKLFKDRLKRWLDDSSYSSKEQHLYQDYDLNEQDWMRIKRAVSELGFDPDGLNTPALDLHCNPLNEARQLFAERQNQIFSTKLAIVHGDLNARNILIDSNNNIFLIDFADVGWDHLLKDFCRLEVEIKYVLTKLSNEEDIQSVIDLDRKMLLNENDKPFSTLNDLLTHPIPASHKFDRMLKCIEKLRLIADRAMGMLDGSQDHPDQYYIGLLHYTLEALRYQQCSNLSKHFALHSVAMLCQALNSVDNQRHVH